MKHLLLIFCLLFPIVALSSIDERKTDIYFANGIDTSPESAYISTKTILKPAIEKEFYQNEDEMKRRIGKVALSYNHTVGFKTDVWESIVQKVDILNLVDLMFATRHEDDVKTQVKAYKESIESGHRVLVVAHSQGNLFTGESFTSLGPCMQKQFEAVSIASPMHADIKEETSSSLNNISA